MSDTAFLSSSTAKKSRERWIDCVRVLAIYLIIVYHLRASAFMITGVADVVQDGLFLLFNQPSARLSFFFLIAGYFVHAKLSLKNWLMRIALLLSAYMIWNSLCLLPAVLTPSLFEAYATKGIAQMYGVGSASKFCIDYPLWFIRDLVVMMLFVPLMRFIPLLWVGLLLLCAYLSGGREWVIADVFAMPEFSFWCLFVLGMYASRVSLARLRSLMPWLGTAVLLLWPLLIFYKGDIVASPWYRDPTVLVLLSVYQALVLMSLGHAIWCYLPRAVGEWMVRFAPSSFLAFAWHGLWIFILPPVLKMLWSPLASSSVVILGLPFFIMWLSRVADRFLSRRAPMVAMLCCYKLPRKKEGSA